MKKTKPKLNKLLQELLEEFEDAAQNYGFQQNRSDAMQSVVEGAEDYLDKAKAALEKYLLALQTRAKPLKEVKVVISAAHTVEAVCTTQEIAEREKASAIEFFKQEEYEDTRCWVTTAKILRK